MSVNPRKFTAEDLLAYRQATILHNKMVGYPNRTQPRRFLYEEYTEEHMRELFAMICTDIHRINNEKGYRQSAKAYYALQAIRIFYEDLFFKGWKPQKVEDLLYRIIKDYKG